MSQGNVTRWTKAAVCCGHISHHQNLMLSLMRSVKENDSLTGFIFIGQLLIIESCWFLCMYSELRSAQNRMQNCHCWRIISETPGVNCG